MEMINESYVYYFLQLRPFQDKLSEAVLQGRLELRVSHSCDVCHIADRMYYHMKDVQRVMTSAVQYGMRLPEVPYGKSNFVRLVEEWKGFVQESCRSRDEYRDPGCGSWRDPLTDERLYLAFIGRHNIRQHNPGKVTAGHIFVDADGDPWIWVRGTKLFPLFESLG